MRREKFYQFRKTSNVLKLSDFNIASASAKGNHGYSTVKNVEIDYHDIKTLMDNALLFDEKNKKFLTAYQVILYGSVTLDDGKEYPRNITIKTLRRIGYDKPEQIYLSVLNEIEKQQDKYGENFSPRFVQFVYLLDKQEKIKLDEQRKIRAEKQRKGREAAKHERMLQEKERKERITRHKREATIAKKKAMKK